MTALSLINDTPATTQVSNGNLITIDPEAGQVLKEELDMALEDLLNYHTRGDYVKTSEVMDLLLDFRQVIDNFPKPGES